MPERKKLGPEPMPVSIRGQVFPSAKAAAEHFGVDDTTIYHAISEGREDTVGLGRGTRPKENRKTGREKSITIGPKTYPTLKSASVALGMHEDYLKHVLRVGGVRARQNLIRRAMEAELKGAKK